MLKPSLLYEWDFRYSNLLSTCSLVTLGLWMRMMVSFISCIMSPNLLWIYLAVLQPSTSWRVNLDMNAWMQFMSVRCSYFIGTCSHLPGILVVEAEYDKGIILWCTCVSWGLRNKYWKSGWNRTFYLGLSLQWEILFRWDLRSLRSMVVNAFWFPENTLLKKVLKNLGCSGSTWPITING